MKKILMTLAVLAASTSVMAQDIDNCYTMEVPPVMSVFGQAPKQKVYVQVSSNEESTFVAIRAPGKYGNSMFASECITSRRDLTCATPLTGKGAVQILRVNQTLNLNNVELALENSSAGATKILGTHQNLELNDFNCAELVTIFKK